MSKSTLELLRKHNEELIKKETEPEQKRVPEKKPEKAERPKKNKEVMYRRLQDLFFLGTKICSDNRTG